MPVFEKYCDKCGEPSTSLKNVNGRMICAKCRGVHFEEDTELTRKAKLRKMWLDK